MSKEHYTAVETNTKTLTRELAWFDQLICFRAYQWRKSIFQKWPSGKYTDPDTLPEFEDVKLMNEQSFEPSLPTL
ncbi:MAG: hypothetical protein JWO44_535 [Bacteroidetes bacterium]|nr:hypothetical protein [Bacteroidota bacterium]